MVCLRNICINTLHKGDDDDDGSGGGGGGDDDDDSNSNKNTKECNIFFQLTPYLQSLIFQKGTHNLTLVNIEKQ